MDEKVVVDTKNGSRVKKSLREVFSHNLVKDALAGDKHSRMLVYRAVEKAEKEEATRKQAEARRPQRTSLQHEAGQMAASDYAPALKMPLAS